MREQVVSLQCDKILFYKTFIICIMNKHFFETENCLFVCVEVLQPSQPTGVMSSAVSLPNHTFTGQA